MELTNALKEKERMAIEFLRAMERPEGYYLAFSGGKDSCIIKHLADKAGIKYVAVYRVTSVDPPELVRFIKEYHPDVKREIPHDSDGKPITMWNLCVKKKMLPSRIARFCCAYLKETGGDGMMTITGVRWAESANRAKNHGKATVKGGDADEFGEDFGGTPRGGLVLMNDNEDSRRQLEHCYKKHKVLINPIVDWTDIEVWQYIRAEGIPYCSLYDEGYHRLGCIGCPMARYGGRTRDFIRYPKYKDEYMRVCRKIIEVRKAQGLPVQTEKAEDYFNNWIGNPNCVGQLSIFDEMEGEEESQ